MHIGGLSDVPQEASADELSLTDMRALVDGAVALAAEFELSRLLDRILEQATILTDSPSASVLLYDAVRKRLFFAAAVGPNAADVLERWGIDSDLGVPLVGSKAGEVFSSGRSIVTQDVEGDSAHFKRVDNDVHHTTRSMICVPLEAAGRRLGVVQLLNKRSGGYDVRDLALLQRFTALAAVAIRNTRMFEDLLAHMGMYGSRSSGSGPAELLAELRAAPHSEHVTVVFADLRGFTRLSQVVERPERTFAYLDEFLSLLATAVLSHEGLVSKFLGDGLMAMFRRDEHAERAVACAFEIVARFDDLRARWDRASNTPLDFLDIGIGMATDLVMLGTVGTERVRDFTAIGASVALAATLTTDHARSGRRIIVDRRTFREAQSLVGSFDGPLTIELRRTLSRRL